MATGRPWPSQIENRTPAPETVVDASSLGGTAEDADGFQNFRPALRGFSFSFFLDAPQNPIAL